MCEPTDRARVVFARNFEAHSAIPSSRIVGRIRCAAFGRLMSAHHCARSLRSTYTFTFARHRAHSLRSICLFTFVRHCSHSLHHIPPVAFHFSPLTFESQSASRLLLFRVELHAALQHKLFIRRKVDAQIAMRNTTSITTPMKVSKNWDCEAQGGGVEVKVRKANDKRSNSCNRRNEWQAVHTA